MEKDWRNQKESKRGYGFEKEKWIKDPKKIRINANWINDERRNLS